MMLCQNTREWKAEPALPMLGAMSLASLPHASVRPSLVSSNQWEGWDETDWCSRGLHFSQHLQFLNPDTVNLDANSVKYNTESKW